MKKPESDSNEVPDRAKAQKEAEENANNNETASCGDPVNAITGAVVGEVTDFTLNTRIPLKWERHYNSQNTKAGHLGIGWQCPADIHQNDPHSAGQNRRPAGSLSVSS